MNNANLFQRGTFKLASGQESRFKIECDVLSYKDWETLAWLLRERLPHFSVAYGVPTGGFILAGMLATSCTLDSVDPILIVDDVYTTGKSISEYREKLAKKMPKREFIGGVVFARAPTPDWITPLFQMTPAEAH